VRLHDPLPAERLSARVARERLDLLVLSHVHLGSMLGL
jgi:hypothetical protein